MAAAGLQVGVASALALTLANYSVGHQAESVPLCRASGRRLIAAGVLAALAAVAAHAVPVVVARQPVAGRSGNQTSSTLLRRFASRPHHDGDVDEGAVTPDARDGAASAVPVGPDARGRLGHRPGAVAVARTGGPSGPLQRLAGFAADLGPDDRRRLGRRAAAHSRARVPAHARVLDRILRACQSTCAPAARRLRHPRRDRDAGIMVRPSGRQRQSVRQPRPRRRAGVRQCACTVQVSARTGRRGRRIRRLRVLRSLEGDAVRRRLGRSPPRRVRREPRDQRGTPTSHARSGRG